MLVGCVSAPPVPTPVIITTPPVTVRAIDWYHQDVTLETDDGWTGTKHLCDPPMQLYIGERGVVQFFWSTFDMPGQFAGNCDRIVVVKQISSE